MTTSVKGPAVFLAQGYGKANWKTLKECATTAASLDYKGLQAHLWNGGPVDLELAAGSKAYCEDLQAIASGAGCPIVELANHCDWQLVRCAPAYLKLHQWPAPEHLHGNATALAEWASTRAKMSVAAARNFGFDRVGGFSGTSIFHLVYPWPQRPKGLVEAAFRALAKAWLPIFDYAEKLGVDVCFELHPGEDLMDGDTFNQFLSYIKHHSRCNILLDLSHMVLGGMTNRHMLGFISTNKDRIRMFHVKDGEFIPTPVFKRLIFNADHVSRRWRIARSIDPVRRRSNDRYCRRQGNRRALPAYDRAHASDICFLDLRLSKRGARAFYRVRTACEQCYPLSSPCMLAIPHSRRGRAVMQAGSSASDLQPILYGEGRS